MNDQKVRRWAGGFGIGGFVVFLAALPLYFIGVGPGVPLEDATGFSEFIARTGALVLVRTTLADALIMVGLLVFLAGFRHLIRRARPDYEWIASLVYGAGLLVIALELVADGLEAGAALDTVVKADPSVVRGLMEASFPLYGAIGLILSALLLAAAGYATLGTGVLHKWTGWFAVAAAAVNLLVAPSILGGTRITGFYTASGIAPFLGQALMLIWFLIASISMIVKRREISRSPSSSRTPKGVT
ncbi:MAG: hypothetical protein ACM32H_02645 [Candidatus Aminicenantes bacterium RBG_16_66_30]